MLIIAAALALQPAYVPKLTPTVPILELKQLCERFETVKTERDRQALVPAIKSRFRFYQGDRDELLMRCERRVQVR